MKLRPAWTVFAITWMAYASYYLCRKQVSICKNQLASTFHLSLNTIGGIETGFLAAYALGQFASGIAGDALGARKLVGVGMLASAAATVFFGLGSSVATFAFAFAINGWAQSTGWPGTMKALTPWFPTSIRGKVMSWWATCYQAGGLVSGALATALLVRWGWRSAFIVPAIWTGAIGVLVLIGLKEHPSERTEPNPVSFLPRASLAALRTPLVWNLGAAYFCLKLIRYSLVFWLPLYLHRALGYSEGGAGYLSLSFEVGGVAGAIVAGLVADRFTRRRGLVLVGMTLGLCASLLGYAKVAAMGASINFAAMMLVGFMLFGPDALLSAATAQDLGGVEAAATVAGVINGVGSIGAILQGSLTAGIATRFGWPALFHLFVGLSIACTLILLPYATRSTQSRVE